MDIKFFDGPLYENFYNEWILTNGCGGFALGFGNLINERKYDGLLIASDENLVRNHLVSSIEEKVFIHNSSFYLDSNNYLNTIYPYGYRHLVKSYMRPFPFFLYSSYPFNTDILIAKYLMMHPDKNINIVFYTNYSSEKINIELKPKFSCRFYHEINKPGSFDNISYLLESDKNLQDHEIFFQRKDNNIGVYTYIYDESEIPNFKILFQGNIYRNIYYSREAERGYDSFEDLINPFTIYKTIEIGETFALVFSDSKISINLENNEENEGTNKEEELIQEIKKIIKQSMKYYQEYPLAFDHPFLKNKPNLFNFNDKKKKVQNIEPKNIFSEIKFDDVDLYTYSEYRKILKLAMIDFKIKNDIIAGYPWFTCWGRDTMISLTAFMPDCDTVKDYHFAYNTLVNYADKMKDGILPNVAFEGKNYAYNNIDSSLWFVIRSYEIFQYLPLNNKKKILNFISEIIINYIYNKNNQFFLNDESLIEINKNDSIALTWMDVVLNGKAITPRYGAPIEINGLWYNSLMITIELMNQLNLDKISNKIKINDSVYNLSKNEIKQLAEKTKESMQKYFQSNLIADRIYQREPIFETRPNFLIALSLPFDFVSKDKIELAIEIAKKELLTPYGLRTLSYKDPSFKKKYIGSQIARDIAYHQGTVWPFLLLFYAKCLEKIYENKKILKKELENIIIRLRNGFIKNHKASIAEVWDGLNPHLAKGCPAQAWSCAALYNIERMIDKLL